MHYFRLCVFTGANMNKKYPLYDINRKYDNAFIHKVTRMYVLKKMSCIPTWYALYISYFTHYNFSLNCVRQFLESLYRFVTFQHSNRPSFHKSVPPNFYKDTLHIAHFFTPQNFVWSG